MENANGQPESSGQDTNYEKELLTKLAFASIDEQRRTRRWNIFFKSLFAIYITYFVVMLIVVNLPSVGMNGKGHTALVDLQGVISAGSDANADSIVSGLRAAFKADNSKAVILRINSPGGSPVQSGYINDEIVRLRKKYPEKKLYAVIADICASGGYYVASAADEIYADKASVVGSIGVLMNGFGFVKGMEKLGIERRLYTAGKSKGFLDPFTKAKPEDIQHIKGLLKNIHEQFIAVVKQGRGDKLKTGTNLFTGYVWTGEESVELGLIDGLGSSSFVAREIVGAEDIIDYTPRPGYLQQFADRLGASIGDFMLDTFKDTSPQLR